MTSWRVGPEVDRAEQRRQEAQPARLGPQLGEVEIARRPDRCGDQVHRLGQHFARHGREGGSAHGAILDRIVHEHGADPLQPERRGVEIADGARPLAPAGGGANAGEVRFPAAAATFSTRQSARHRRDLACS